MRYKVIEKVSQIPTSSISEANQVAAMIAAAAEVKQQVNWTGQVHNY